MILAPAQPTAPPDVRPLPWLRDGRQVKTINGDLVAKAVDWRAAQKIVRDHVIG